ncbi:MAG: polyprenyl synthetase family protein [Actinomycetia bacterium]|nr:polyprenyl synthetase family protein [Actinomycetes bacterium]
MASPLSFPADDPLGAGFLAAVDEVLSGFLETRRAGLAAIDAGLTEVADIAAETLAGGKRLRAAFAWWGAMAAGESGSPELLRAVASLEVLHAGLLVHDDLIDQAATRRGRPAAHHRFAAQAAAGEGDSFGLAGAVLLGALLMGWANDLFEASGLPSRRLAQGRPLLAAMRNEVLAGQLLDSRAQHHLPLWQPGSSRQDPPLDAAGRASHVIIFKTALYTVARPLEFGARLGGASPGLLKALRGIGVPLGRAFQLRDDLLDVFGDVALTGKETGGDLREGKETLLVAHALGHAAPAQAATLQAVLGNAAASPRQIAAARRVLVATGARQAVETHVEEEYERAMARLTAAPVTAVARDGLARLAHACVVRDH